MADALDAVRTGILLSCKVAAGDLVVGAGIKGLIGREDDVVLAGLGEIFLKTVHATGGVASLGSSLIRLLLRLTGFMITI